MEMERQWKLERERAKMTEEELAALEEAEAKKKEEADEKVWHAVVHTDSHSQQKELCVAGSVPGMH